MITLYVNEHSSEKVDRLIQMIKETESSYLERGKTSSDGTRQEFILFQKKKGEMAKVIYKVNLPYKEFDIVYH